MDIKAKIKIKKQKKSRVCFVLTNYSWALVWGWNVIDIPIDTSLKKVDFTFPRIFQSLG